MIDIFLKTLPVIGCHGKQGIGPHAQYPAPFPCHTAIFRHHDKLRVWFGAQSRKDFSVEPDYVITVNTAGDVAVLLPAFRLQPVPVAPLPKIGGIMPRHHQSAVQNAETINLFLVGPEFYSKPIPLRIVRPDLPALCIGRRLDIQLDQNPRRRTCPWRRRQQQDPKEKSFDSSCPLSTLTRINRNCEFRN